jgi:hypothetical protein
MRISQKDFDRIRHLKTLDFQVCDFCQKLNILNLGWEPFGKFYCRLHKADYLVCWELCYKVCRNIWGCQLYKKFGEVPPMKLAAPLKKAVNQEHYRASCYLCSKELKGAGKHGTIKNRNNPSFWGISTEFKILCLKCLGKKFYSKLEPSKRKSFSKYVKRGYE